MGAEKHCGIPLRFVLITRDRWHEPKNRSAVVLCLLVNIVVKIMLQRRIQPLSLPGTIDEVVVGIHQNSVAAPIASPVSGLRRHAEVYEGLVANPLPVVFSLVDGCWPRHHGLPRAVTTLWFVGWPCRLDLHAIGAVDGGCAGNSPRISFIVRFHPGQIVEAFVTASHLAGSPNRMHLMAKISTRLTSCLLSLQPSGNACTSGNPPRRTRGHGC